MGNLENIALTMGTSWASGINLYATLLILGYLHHTGSFLLPENLAIIAHPLVMFVVAVMYVVEFFADKIPGVDTMWDTLHTFIRIPAGAVLAAGAMDDGGLVTQLAAGLVGGGLASATHATKTGTRVLINTSPEPFSNWTASVSEDAMVVGGLWTALHHPVLFVGFLAIFLLLLVWILLRLWRALHRIFSTLGRWLRLSKSSTQTET